MAALAIRIAVFPFAVVGFLCALAAGGFMWGIKLADDFAGWVE